MPVTPEQLTLLGAFIAALAAGLAKKWVWGWTYDAKVQDLQDMTEDRNFWRDMTLQSMGHADKALNVAVEKTRDT